MKNINILSLTQAYNSLTNDNYIKFLQYYCIEIKNDEVKDIESLVNNLLDKTIDKNIFNHFYVGYKIPQIGKEFDLLRFGENFIINIELKSTSTKEKIQKQLIRNKYYLSFLGKKTYSLTYVSDTNRLFFLDDSNELKKTSFLKLAGILIKQKHIENNDINQLFNPSDYLVSPFNSTKKFLKNEYFLTQQQEEVKNKVLNTLKNEGTPNFFSIAGSAGTGKTLLTYNIANEIKKIAKKSLIIHCGILNNGQLTLIDKHNWNIVAIKHSMNIKLSNYDLVIIDEAQRLLPWQFEKIVKKIKSTNGNCIFSFDKQQTLGKAEENRKISQHINEIDSIFKIELSEKIRTNKEISTFIKVLFDSTRNLTISCKDNIELNYFKRVEDAKEYLEWLDKKEWEIIRFTPSQYDKEHHKNYSEHSNETSHQIIGQEFDGVVITIDKFFSYKKDGGLIYKGNSYYPPVKMLFQNITRTRKKLNIVIINNEELLNRCLSVLQN